MLQRSMGGQDGVVGLDHSGGDLQHRLINRSNRKVVKMTSPSACYLARTILDTASLMQML